MVNNIQEYGSHMSMPRGFIVKIGNDQYKHKFGGCSWDIIDNITNYQPTLLLVLDKLDPQLSTLELALDEIPICSHINCSAWHGRQQFKIDPLTRSIKLVSLEVSNIESFHTELPNPFPEKSVIIRPMNTTDYPVDRDTYSQACERFLNSNDFIRVLGPPLWMELEQKEICICGTSMKYMCSVGSQAHIYGDFIDEINFYIGEGVLYFFLCPNCLLLTVISQSV
jgi:hypothetical protein